MDGFQLAIVAMALTDSQWRHDNSRHGHRVTTAAEFDSMADYWGRHWPDLKGFMVASATAVRARWRRRASARIAPTPLPSAEAKSPV